MRRIATTTALVLAASSLCGCQSMQTPWSGPPHARSVETVQGHEPVIANDQAASGVSDAVMLGSQGQNGFSDPVSGP